MERNMNEKTIATSGYSDVGESSESELSFRERLAYGTGDFANNIVFSAISLFLVYYYTDIIKIDAAIVGTIMLISRVLDGILDLFMGVVVDRTKSKHGKARSWILRMIIPYAISGVILFSAPINATETFKIVYIVISYNLSQIIFTALLIPYATLGALITQNQYERGVLGIFRMLLATAGTMFINTFTLKTVNYFGGDHRAWTLTFALFGLLSIALLLFTFLGTKERVTSNDKDAVSIKDGVSSLFKNKYWCIVAFTVLALYFILTISGAGTIYYAKTVLGDANLVVQIGNATTITQIVTMFLMAYFIKKMGKRNVFILGLVVSIFGYGFLATNPTNYDSALFSSILKGIGFGAMASSMFGMLADTIEYGEWKTGIRVAGLANSASSFGSKVGGGLGGAALGWVLSIGGYNADAKIQSASSISAINSLFIYIPLVISIAVLGLMFTYKLDKEYPTIIKELNERNKK
jgi:GPH family glycoside/pentoside/hexuronide:cation symporter